MLNTSESKTQLPMIIDSIVASYSETTTTHHLDHIPPPRFQVVVEILDDLREIIYPGYRNYERLYSSNVEYHIGSIVDRLHDRLSELIARAMIHSESNGTAIPAKKQQEILQLADRKTLKLLSQLPDIRRKLAKDVEAVYAGDPACKSLDEAILCYPSIEAVTIHRLAHSLYQLQVPLIPRMMSEYAHSETGIDIHPGATIGEYFFIDHGTGIVIGGTSIIGNWVKLYQGVTLGAVSFPKDETGELVRNTKRHPTIEDNVVIYANATILGGKTVIGKDSVIGSSVWLTHSIPPKTTIMIEKPNLKIRTTGLDAFDWRI